MVWFKFGDLLQGLFFFLNFGNYLLYCLTFHCTQSRQLDSAEICVKFFHIIHGIGQSSSCPRILQSWKFLLRWALHDITQEGRQKCFDYIFRTISISTGPLPAYRTVSDCTADRLTQVMYIPGGCLFYSYIYITDLCRNKMKGMNKPQSTQLNLYLL